jgi:hypothetical protein
MEELKKLITHSFIMFGFVVSKTVGDNPAATTVEPLEKSFSESDEEPLAKIQKFLIKEKVIVTKEPEQPQSEEEFEGFPEVCT